MGFLCDLSFILAAERGAVYLSMANGEAQKLPPPEDATDGRYLNLPQAS